MKVLEWSLCVGSWGAGIHQASSSNKDSTGRMSKQGCPESILQVALPLKAGSL